MKRIFEVLDEVSKAKTKQAKIDILRNNASYALRTVLEGTYDPVVKFVFDKIPEYKKEVNVPAGMGYTSLDVELARFYLFVEGNPRVDPNLSLERKTHILIQMLEALEPREAEVLANMLMKNLHVKGLNADLVEEAFPGLINKG